MPAHRTVNAAGVSARAPAPRRGARGAALLLVLWLITLLTALVGSFALAARIENMQAHVLARGLVARNAARAGIEYALTRVELDDPRLQWRPDGQPHEWRYADARVEIRIVDESGKVDLNQADATLLAGLLQAIGGGAPADTAAGRASPDKAAGTEPVAIDPLSIDEYQARQLAAAILDWRDRNSLTQPVGGAEDPAYASAGRPYGAKDAPFEGIAELQQVLGFTPALYDAIKRYVTVHTGRALPDTAFAPPAVLDAMGLEGDAAARSGLTDLVTGRPLPGPSNAAGIPVRRRGSGTYSIDSRARLADGRQARLQVVVRMGGATPGSAYTALRWQEGASSR